MAYINRHSKDYFTWSASQPATYWMRNEEERELDRRWKTAWYSCETRFRDACLESNSRARYTCKLKSCIYIYIYVYSKRNWRKKKEKKKNKPEQNLQNHLNGIDSSNHVTRVFLAYKKKKKNRRPIDFIIGGIATSRVSLNRRISGEQTRPISNTSISVWIETFREVKRVSSSGKDYERFQIASDLLDGRDLGNGLIENVSIENCWCFN